MNFTIEKDWTTAARHSAVVLRNNCIHAYAGYLTHRCGYVGVDAKHPLFGVSYMKPQAQHLEVHGGLTYSDGKAGGNYPVPSDLWWFGFDAAHGFDTEDGGRSLQFMEDQCERLSAQLNKVHLLPCPFCGGTDIRSVLIGLEWGKDLQVYCYECRASVPSGEGWNKRVTP
jgi:hypothetical protein